MSNHFSTSIEENEKASLSNLTLPTKQAATELGKTQESSA